MNGWLLHPPAHDGDLHVTPENDLRPHPLSMDCWCRPFRLPDVREVVAHNALDQRERYETGELRPS